MNPVRVVLASVPMFFVSGALAFAQPAGSEEYPMTPEQAISVSSQGQNVAVAGVATVSEAIGLPGTFIRLTAPDSAIPFVGYIDIDNEPEFPNPAQFDGRKIKITGVVETRGSVPMIELTSPHQIALLP
jgi:hypothetical protein